MAQHESKIIEKTKLSDGQIAVLLQCCDDPQHQSWHTLHITPDTTKDSITAWLQDRKQHVQDQHERVLLADAHLDSLV